MRLNQRGPPARTCAATRRPLTSLPMSSTTAETIHRLGALPGAALKGLSLDQLQEWSVAQGLPRYRGAQLFDWLYGRGVSDPQLMDNLPRSLRRRLAEEYRLQTAAIEKVTASSVEPTRKYLFTLAGGIQVEAVSMLAGDRHTVCLSSQAGCNLGCGFCATAALGLQRNLTTGEMMDQLLLVQQERKITATNVVFMGMGEPFLNYAAVLAAADIMHHPRGPDLGSQRITISTAGVVPKIERFTTEERLFRLAISLNAADDTVRSRLMPLNDTWPLDHLMAAARNYCAIAGRTITFEYVLLAGTNDSLEDARRLLKLLRGCRAKINIIPYNEIGGPYRRPDEASVERFTTELRQGDFPVIVRVSNGVDIAAGCGQLALGAA